MFFSALIETDQQQVKCLPEKAVVNFDGKEFVFVVVDEVKKQYKMTEIKTGASSDGFTEIILSQDLSSKTLFVTKGAYELLSFLKNTEE
jgi:cobalt-zinc-cadmium efflux system membrane fusion protein